jgi:hypothetical protein
MEQAIIKLDNQLCILTYRGVEEYGLGYAIDYVVASWKTFVEDDFTSEFDLESLISNLDLDFDAELECGFEALDIEEELKKPFPKAL